MMLAVNIKNCSISSVLMAADQKLQKSFKKMILPNITSPECQPDAE